MNNSITPVDNSGFTFTQEARISLFFPLQPNAASLIPEYFVENVHAALRVVAMPTQDDELDNFLTGSPRKAVEAEVERAKAESKKAKKTSIAKGVISLHVSGCGFGCHESDIAACEWVWLQLARE